MIQFDEQQQLRASELIESMTWGDMDIAILVIYRSLLLALEATSSDFARWERDSESMGHYDEFSLTPDEVVALSDEWKLAYVARLLRSLALMFGVGTEFGNQVLVAEHEPLSPAGLLCGLNDIACMPLTDTSPPDDGAPTLKAA
jgi:hypothetical protein